MDPVYYAVPSKYLPVLSEERAKEILEEIKNTPKRTKEEKEELRKWAKEFFTKPGGDNGSLLYK